MRRCLLLGVALAALAARPGLAGDVAVACDTGGLAEVSAPEPAPAPAAAPASSSAQAAAPGTARTTACDRATGRVLRVGPGHPLVTPSAAARIAADGDVVRIDAGTYRGDVAVWRAPRLTLCGEGGRAVLQADGQSAQGKAIWVFAPGATEAVVDGIEFHGAAVADRNGAGIRAEARHLTVLHSGFYDNENGLLAGNGSGVVRILHSEFARNGHADGRAHNLYIGQAEALQVVASHFHGARTGHQLKSRARSSCVAHSRFQDGPDGQGSYLAEFPEGGEVLLHGNLFHKGPRAPNGIAVSFGAEGLKGATHTLALVHNSLALARPGGAFLWVAPGTQAVRLVGNLWAGSGAAALLTGGFPPAQAEARHNHRLDARQLEGAERLDAPGFWPDAATRAAIALPEGPHAGPAHDAPRPRSLRLLPPGPRQAGALQAPP